MAGRGTVPARFAVGNPQSSALAFATQFLLLLGDFHNLGNLRIARGQGGGRRFSASMRIAMNDLKLDSLWVLHPCDKSWPLDAKIRSVSGNDFFWGSLAESEFR